jgi:hypothetical protein
MKLKEIRQRTAYDANTLPTQKQATRTWLTSKSSKYPLALTLTLKQIINQKTTFGTYRQCITRLDCERIAKRFIQKLNKEVFGNSAKRHNKTLKYLVVVEGERTYKQLHLHMAIGDLPKHVRYNEFEGFVKKAKIHVEEIDVQHKVDIADSGWMEYITKELGAKDTENVLWNLA